MRVGSDEDENMVRSRRKTRNVGGRKKRKYRSKIEIIFGYRLAIYSNYVSEEKVFYIS